MSFDAMAIRRKLLSHEPNPKKCFDDVVNLIVLVLSRGTTVCIPGRERMSPEAKLTMQQLMNKYGIVQSFNKAQAKPDTLTLSRIAAAHPETAFKILKCSVIERAVSINQMVALGFVEFKSELRGSYVFAILPKSATLKVIAIASAALAYMAVEANVLRKPNTSALTLQEGLEKSKTYAKAVLNSNINIIAGKKLFEDFDASDDIYNGWLAAFSTHFPDFDVVGYFELTPVVESDEAGASGVTVQKE